MSVRPEPWHALSASEALSKLGSGPGGLDSAEAARRLQEHGPNLATSAKQREAWRILLAQFTSLLVYLLIAAALVSLLVGDLLEAGAILGVLVLNAALGFVQEHRAQRALEALRSLVAPAATLLRDGVQQRLPASEVVPGDVFLLEAGDIVPADGRVIEAAQLQCSEALLTGESAPIEKSPAAVHQDTDLAERTSMVYGGALVQRGRATCVSVATGTNTELGRIAAMVAAARQETTPLQARLSDLARVLVAGALLLCALVFAVGVLRGISATEMFLTAVSLAVAAIPEGLPATTTVVLALGVQRMARRNVIIRRLSSVETLGTVTVIFTDKTGTLTENRMAVQDFWCPGEDDDCLRVLVLCNNSELGAGDSAVGDPTEVALLQYAGDRGVAIGALRSAQQRLLELPFDSSRAMMTVVVRTPQGVLEGLTKGAPEAVFGRMSGVAGGATPEDARRAVEEMTSGGLRVLALARRLMSGPGPAEDVESELELVGLVGLGDPVREGVAEAIAEARSAGARPVMLTGDHPLTATVVGRRLGLEGEVLTGRDVDAWSNEDLVAQLGGASIFARVSSEHKLKIVQAAKRGGEVTAMTGDGVNDAPALKESDIGVAMGQGGTEVAREASDMVLLDNSFASIVSAIEEGRIVYSNISRVVHFLLSCNLAELAVIFVGLLLWSTSLLTPLQILYVNLLTDGLPAMALGLEPASPGIMRRQPRSRRSQMVTWHSLVPIAGIGGLLAAVTLIAFVLGRTWGDTDLGTDMVLATLVSAHVGIAFVFRSEDTPVTRLARNWWLVAAAGSSLLLLWLIFFVPGLQTLFEVKPFAARHLVAVVALALLPLAIAETVKASGVIRRFRLGPD